LNETLEETRKQLGLEKKQLETVLGLLADNTVPFIARYRKEKSGGLDEEALRSIEEAYRYEKKLAERKEQVLRLISERATLDESLKQAIRNARRLSEVEDLFRPYREKRRTRGKTALNKGLGPFAERIASFPVLFEPATEAATYLGPRVQSVEEAIQGAKDILAEQISDRADVRKLIRSRFNRSALLCTSRKQEAEDPRGIYRMYYEHEEPIRRIKPFRILAINRGEKEGVLNVRFTLEDKRLIDELKRHLQVNERSVAGRLFLEALEDAYRRLLKPSVVREVRRDLFERAEERAIEVFKDNLRHLLLTPPLKYKRVLGVDPAYKTGCKLAVVDVRGRLEKTGTVYPHTSGKSLDEAIKEFKDWLVSNRVDVVAVGNGTASRETEQLIAKALKATSEDIRYTVVDETGASVYSASGAARREFPDLPTEMRSAVSIARRLQDPLSEFVKIDPRSLGVGQYQHDLTQSKLTSALSFVVETVVNQVGVDVNQSSRELLQFVSGFSPSLAERIVSHRQQHGPFISREALKDVHTLGKKTFTQAAGFLRIADGTEPLDATGVHPESYPVADGILESLSCTKADIGSEKIRKALKQTTPQTLASRLDSDEATIEDIFKELMEPGRDPRLEAPDPVLRTDVTSLKTLEKGMRLSGTVRNVVDFGAFVDCGVGVDGLIHISKLSDAYIQHPSEVISLGDVVDVEVLNVDVERERLQLSLMRSRTPTA